MIIIDSQADVKLLEQLERLRTAPNGARCLHLKLSPVQQELLPLKERIRAAISLHILSGSSQVYFCDDGDIFILSQNIPPKEIRALLGDIAAYINPVLPREWAFIYECNLEIGKLLIEVEKKVDVKKHIQEREKQGASEQKQAQKRKQILDVDIHPNAVETMKRKRKDRTNTEIMVIEDDIFSRRLVKNVLEKACNLTLLGDAEKALYSYVTQAPDVLFLDINLPDVTGHELLQKILAIDPDAYVIMLSGNSDKANIMQAMGMGAKGFIAKPFTREKIYQYLDRCPTITEKKQ